ncbi:RHS repeat-associated core domain-containing protein [Pseudescherichia sp.]|uniref:RHS repeat-associated core domain-containing protein n=1 Tax=Pseudescherichia sp. TaxID=2055881 RepID=UPI002898642F|nr:RHS repeat-associated core domain-containing protein [Pseudescherichia sp.]
MGNPNVATGTPVVSTHDNRGLAVRALNWNHDSSDNPLRLLVTQTQTDDASRVVSHRDPRLFAAWSADSPAPANLCTTPSLAGQVLRRESTDSGEQVTLFDAAGRAVWIRDGRLTVQTVAYDEPGRPSSGSEQLSGSSEIRVSWRSEYGDSGPADDGSQGNNLRGVCVAQYDSGGLSEVNSVALSGVVLSQGQRFLASAEALPDWPEDEAGREALLEAETYTTSVTADARGTVLKQTDAKGHVQAWRYNVSGAACYQTVTPAGGETQTLLSNVTWSAAGQVLTESAGNGVTTQYSYDPQNQWLATITAQRADKTMLQALSYGYDFIGNITSLSDGSVASRYYRNQATGGTRLFTYDALYQLLSATGRENANHSGMQYSGLPVLSDDSQYVNYTRSYQYDDSGNLQTLKHSGAANFTRTMTTDTISNRSVQQNDGGPQDPDEVAGWFDANGNLLTLQARAPVTDDSGLDPLVWDGSNNLQSVTVLSRSSGDNDREIYQYSGSRRVRKQTRTLANGDSQLWSVDEVRYLPGLELRKSWQETTDSSASPSLSEELHVITGQAGRAGIRVLHWETGRPQEIAANDQVRWSVDDNIGSLALELDAEGQLISREEYYPFGGTAVWAGRNEVEASYKTVRYSGKERDSTGLYYYGHRYYAPWLCRWVSADPAGEVDGLNLFRMVGNNPVTFKDSTGLYTNEEWASHMLEVMSSFNLRPLPENFTSFFGTNLMEQFAAMFPVVAGAMNPHQLNQNCYYCTIAALVNADVNNIVNHTEIMQQDSASLDEIDLLFNQVGVHVSTQNFNDHMGSPQDRWQATYDYLNRELANNEAVGLAYRRPANVQQNVFSPGGGHVVTVTRSNENIYVLDYQSGQISLIDRNTPPENLAHESYHIFQRVTSAAATTSWQEVYDFITIQFLRGRSQSGLIGLEINGRMETSRYEMTSSGELIIEIANQPHTVSRDIVLQNALGASNEMIRLWPAAATDAR